jgi:hypothetical protein
MPKRKKKKEDGADTGGAAAAASATAPLAAPAASDNDHNDHLPSNSTQCICNLFKAMYLTCTMHCAYIAYNTMHLSFISNISESTCMMH